MKILRDSSLREYAEIFWQREALKNTAGRKALEEIRSGADPVQLLAHEKDGHPYKLPGPENRTIRIALLNQPDELASLLIHPGMSQDDWMRKRGLAPDRDMRKLSELATHFLSLRYFERPNADGTQAKCFLRWKSERTLQNAIKSDFRPLVECADTNTCEIVDGWGRLLPYVALLQLGLDFVPVECFLASKD